MIENAISAGIVAGGALGGALLATTVQISSETLIPAGAVVGFAFVVWRAAGEWRAVQDTLSQQNNAIVKQGETLEKMVKLMESRPCIIVPNENCPIQKPEAKKE